MPAIDPPAKFDFDRSWGKQSWCLVIPMPSVCCSGQQTPLSSIVAGRLALIALLLAGLPRAIAAEVERANYFDDPFVQVTAAIAGCPPQHGPTITKDEMRSQAHARAERGTRCYQSGRCRLPNSYLYDKEIIPRVKQAILIDGRFSDTSVWIEGQRRWVTLKGCVRTRAQSKAIESLVRGVDDVEAVINELILVGGK